MINFLKFTKNAVYVMLVLSTLPLVAYAAPVVTGITGTVTHGTTVTVSGSGFGTKTTVPPLVWDNCSGTNVSTLWDGYWPNVASNSTYNLAYRTPIRSVGLPHSHITKYMAGCHCESTGNNTGWNVMMWKDFSNIANGTIFYMSSYVRTDPSWNGSLGSPADNNFKTFDYSITGTPYTTTNGIDGQWYLAYGPPTDLASPQWIVDATLPLPDQNGHNAWWGGGASSTAAWVKTEYEFKISSGNDGYAKVWDNGVLVINYLGPTDWYNAGWTSTNNRNISLGGYARAYGATTQWRYWADIYLDNTPQRSVICAGSSWGSRGRCEVQIPSAWSPSSITLIVNQGAFADNSTAYLYVVDATGAASPQRTITFGSSGSGGGGSSTTPGTAVLHTN